jgi:methionyl-tRNA synthetase
MLQALDLPLPMKLLSHAHWTIKQKKMSKSVGNVADPFEAIDRYGIDTLRYYMARAGGRFKDDVGMHCGRVDRSTVDSCRRLD